MNPSENDSPPTATEPELGADTLSAQPRKPFVAPELKLRGDLTEVTAGAFGTFSP